MPRTIKKSYIKIKEARTTLIVPHLDGTLTFIHPLKGPGIYTEVRKQIDDSNLFRPTTAETISLIYAAFKNKDNEYSQEILKILKKGTMWCYTKNLWTPKGVYVVDGSKLDKLDLEKRLQTNDKSVRFVPNGFKLREQTSKELETNEYIIAHAGEEGAHKLAEIASEFKNKPYVCGLENITGDIERVTCLYGDCNGFRLGFDGEEFGGARVGFASGVMK